MFKYDGDSKTLCLTPSAANMSKMLYFYPPSSTALCLLCA